LSTIHTEFERINNPDGTNSLRYDCGEYGFFITINFKEEFCYSKSQFLKLLEQNYLETIRCKLNEEPY
jgi:hypothetical protein